MLLNIPRNRLMKNIVLKCESPNKRKTSNTLLLSYFPHTFHIASQIPFPKPHPDQDTHLDTLKTSPTKGRTVPHMRKFK